MTVKLEPWARETAAEFRAVKLPTVLQQEARNLAWLASRSAPRATGHLSLSIYAVGPRVETRAPYASVVNTGGVISARRHGYLTIPVRPGFRPGPGFVIARSSKGPLVVRAGTHEIWALLRRSVTVRGTRYLDTALTVHLATAQERVGSQLPGQTDG